MKIRADTYIMPARNRKGTCRNGVCVYPLFSQSGQPAFLSSLSGFDDVTMEAGKQFIIPGNNNAVSLLIPVSGGIEVTGRKGPGFVPAGEWCELLPRDENITLSNPFDQAINFLVLTYSGHGPEKAPLFRAGALGLSGLPAPIPLQAPFQVEAGRYGERETIIRKLPGPGLLAYVLEGIFEVHDRLLDSRDGLSSPDCVTIESECFTRDGIVLWVYGPELTDRG